MSSPPPRSPRSAHPRTLLVAGIAVLLAGGVLLLWNLGYLPRFGRLWPVAVILAGLVVLFLAWPRPRGDRWIVPGMLLALGGCVVLLMETVLAGRDIARIWPAFMLVTGLSLVPYGYRKKGPARTALIVPGLFISALAVLFLPFSLRGESGGLAAFVRQWWPLLVVLLGAVLVVSFFSSRRPKGKV